jgi:Domain of unknown function (DUF4157)
VPAAVDDVVRAPGQPLGRATRTRMEARFGHDFGHVRVHADHHAAEVARTLGARAFTVGSDVAFAAGSFAPETREGERLLAHELAHVVQQGGRRHHGTDAPGGRPTDALEREADAAADALARGLGPVVAGRVHTPLVQGQGTLSCALVSDPDTRQPTCVNMGGCAGRCVLHNPFPAPPFCTCAGQESVPELLPPERPPPFVAPPLRPPAPPQDVPVPPQDVPAPPPPRPVPRPTRTPRPPKPEPQPPVPVTPEPQAPPAPAPVGACTKASCDEYNRLAGEASAAGLTCGAEYYGRIGHPTCAGERVPFFGFSAEECCVRNCLLRHEPCILHQERLCQRREPAGSAESAVCCAVRTCGEVVNHFKCFAECGASGPKFWAGRQFWLEVANQTPCRVPVLRGIEAMLDDVAGCTAAQ